MSYFPILTDVVPCAGTGCRGHAACPNYQAMEGSDPHEYRIATCLGRPGFPREFEVVAKSAAVPA